MRVQRVESPSTCRAARGPASRDHHQGGGKVRGRQRPGGRLERGFGCRSRTGKSLRAGPVGHLAWLRERDRAADELYEKLVELRLTFHLQFGAGSSDELFGIEDDIPIAPQTLHQIAEQAYDSLIDRDLELPSQRLGDLVVHPRRLAAGLERPLRNLGAALAAPSLTIRRSL